jgi:glycosyltransferase involved in cell wall biosynthesis
MVTCAAKLPSVELAAIIPLSELEKRNLCSFRYKDEVSLSLDDIIWCDILITIRGTSARTIWAVQEARKLNRVILGYWDDDFLSVPTHNPNHAYYSSPEVQNNISILFSLIDKFFSPNPKLAIKLSNIHGNTVGVLPGVLGTPTLNKKEHNKNQLPIVGFAGSIVYNEHLDQLIGPALEILAKETDFQVHVIGAEPQFIGKLPIQTIQTKYFSDYQEYLAITANLNWDIGLAPQIDCEFTKHKFYNKLLEYTYIGCAGVYSKLEPYSSVVIDGITGLLVENKVDAWKDAILRLINDPELRIKIYTNAYEFVRTHHSRDVVTSEYITALAPYLSHRAPKVSKRYIALQKPSYCVTSLWETGREYAKIYGIRRLLIRGPRYIVVSIWKKLLRRL